MTNLPYLSLSIWIPIFGGLLAFLVPDHKTSVARFIGLAFSLLGFLITLPLYWNFSVASSSLQFVELATWIPLFNSNYTIGIDGISLPFILLNGFVTLVVVVASLKTIQRNVAFYVAVILLMSGLINGVFCAQDGLLFYVFFEASLIPLYFIIGIWGGPNRKYAAIKFFLYTLLGSLLMLVAFIYLFQKSGGSFSLASWRDLKLDLRTQLLVFWAFFASFAVKVPMWPVHTWLPDAHVEAPTGGSVILAAIALKIGAYGFLRFSLPIVPDACVAMAPLMISLSLIAIIYIGFVAIVQSDMKKLVAYSSISHMGLVTLGIFLFSTIGVEGALVQMISHGFVSAAMFLCIGILYEQTHSRRISDYGGIINVMPKFAVLFMIFSMANIGLPATSGFVGEFLIILGAIKSNLWVGFLAATTLIFSASYTLWMYKRVMYGETTKNTPMFSLHDIGWQEAAFLSILAVGILAIGTYPFPLTELMHASVANLINGVAVGKL